MVSATLYQKALCLKLMPAAGYLPNEEGLIFEIEEIGPDRGEDFIRLRTALETIEGTATIVETKQGPPKMPPHPGVAYSLPGTHEVLSVLLGLKRLKDIVTALLKYAKSQPNNSIEIRRGHDSIRIVGNMSFEQVARLLVDSGFAVPPSQLRDKQEHFRQRRTKELLERKKDLGISIRQVEELVSVFEEEPREKLKPWQKKRLQSYKASLTGLESELSENETLLRKHLSK